MSTGPHYTNDQNLPEAYARAAIAARRRYSRQGSDISVTGLINPPRIFQLSERHADEIVIDVSQLVRSFMGSMAHGILESAAAEGLEIAERRLFATVQGPHGPMTISGQVDLQRPQGSKFWEPVDWKSTTVWTWIMGGRYEWVPQLNCYCWLMRKNDIEPAPPTVYPIFMDWKLADFKRNPREYPPCQIMRFPIPMWSEQQAEDYVLSRVALHQEAALVSDDDLPLCSREERWAKDTKYAVKKVGGQRAVNGGVVGTREQAEELIANLPREDFYEVEERPGESVRCAEYCSVSAFCGQWQKEESERKRPRGFAYISKQRGTK